MMLPLEVDDQIAKRATARALREGYAGLPDLVRMLVYRYAYGKDAATGGLQRAANLTPKERQDAASNAAHARWATTPEDARSKAGKHASDARWGGQHRALALARKLTAEKPKRVPAWPLVDEPEEGGEG